MPALGIGKRYKFYYKYGDPNRYEWIGTLNSRLPNGKEIFTDVVYADGTTTPVLEIYPWFYEHDQSPVEVTAGGKRKHMRRKTRRRINRKRRNTRRRS